LGQLKMPVPAYLASVHPSPGVMIGGLAKLLYRAITSLLTITINIKILIV